MSWDEYYDDDDGGFLADMDYKAQVCDENDGECAECELRTTCAYSTVRGKKNA